MGRHWLVVLLLALVLAHGVSGQPEDDVGPDPIEEPPVAPPGGGGPGGATASKPPKEQAPDPAAAKPPGGPTTPPVTPPATPGPSAGPAGPQTAVTPPQPNPAAATGAAGPKPGVTPTPPGVTPPSGTTPPGAAATAPPGSSTTPPGGTATATGATGATAPGVPPGLPAPGATTTTPVPGVTPPSTAAPGTAVPGAVAPGATGLPVAPTGVPTAPIAPSIPPGAGSGGAAVPGVAGGLPPGPGSVSGDAAVAVVVTPGSEQPAGGNGSAQVENSTAIEGLSPQDTSTKLVSALLGALGAQLKPAPERPNPIAAFEDGGGASSSSTGAPAPKTKRRRRRAKTSSGSKVLPTSASLSGMSFQDLRGSKRLTDGLLTTADGSSFCVAGKDMFVEPAPAASSRNGTSFLSVDDTFDPACDDDAINKAKYCAPPKVITSRPLLSTFMEASSPAGAASGEPEPMLEPINNVLFSLNPVGNTSNLACTQGFTKMGSAPRSLAVVLIKWGRHYYKTKEECCKEAGSSAADCDCKWNGYTWDNLPPPSAYSRMFTDECDGKASINRAYYDMSGGMVTFHGRARVPTPATVMAELSVRNGSAPESSPAPFNTMNGYLTDKSYLDPDGVDVYGWAVLNDMRTADGQCKDWCGEATAQLGVNGSEYNHIMCMALYSQSNTICDVCDATKGPCAGTCPANGGITAISGCGCGTCSFAWGGQSSCSRAEGAGARTGLSVPIATYDDLDNPLLPGMQPRAYVKITRGNKVYMSHELGHNMGLTHTGALRCTTTANVINRQPTGCTPDWYGDQTSFMGSGPDLLLPNAMKYRVRWLPRGTLKEHITGTEQRYTLKAATSRRPSWQESNTLRWFDPTQDTLTVRIPLVYPSPEAAAMGGYKCPCPACPQCAPQSCSVTPASTSMCCIDESCLDKGLSYLYVELHQPYRNDNNPSYKGIAIRMMGDLSTCTSTRAVPTHVDAEGKPKYLLDTPDPTGTLLGSRYDDPLRRVSVILEEWTRSQAVVRVIA